MDVVTLFIVTGGLVRAMYDTRFKMCKCSVADRKVFLVQWFHASVKLFSFFGWVYNNKVILCIYLITIVFIPIGWEVFDGCFITNYIQNKCKIREEFDVLRDVRPFTILFIIYGILTALFKLVYN